MEENVRPMNVYLAGGIFFYADLLRNTEWSAKIREAFPGAYLYNPLEIQILKGSSSSTQLLCNLSTHSNPFSVKATSELTPA